MARRDVTETRSGVLTLDIGTAVRKLLRAIGRMLIKRVAGKVVTLDIDSSGIKVVEVRGGVVRKWADISLESVSDEEEVTTDESTLGKTVKALMASNGIKAKKVIASLSGLYTVSRIMSESRLPPAPTTQEAVSEMASEIMPFSRDRLHLSWQTITLGEDERLVLMVGVSREAIDKQVRALKAVAINPYIVELKAMALTRAVNRPRALILNIEPSSFDIVIVANGVPETIRTVGWQQDNYAKEEAAEYLVTNLETTVEFYNLHHMEDPLDVTTPFFITGQLSVDMTLMEKLKAVLAYPVEPLTPPLEYPAYLPVSQYAVNIGLALRAMTPLSQNDDSVSLSPIEINLLPDLFRPWHPTAKQLYSVVVVIAAIALLFPLFQAATETMDKTAALQSKFDLLNNQLTLKKLEIKNREPLQKAINEYHNIVNMGGGYTEELETIREEAEKLGVRVASITHEGTSITISCQAEDYITFREYLAALEASGRFATPIPPPEGYPYITGGTIKMTPNPGE